MCHAKTVVLVPLAKFSNRVAGSFSGGRANQAKGHPGQREWISWHRHFPCSVIYFLLLILVQLKHKKFGAPFAALGNGWQRQSRTLTLLSCTLGSPFKIYLKWKKIKIKKENNKKRTTAISLFNKKIFNFYYFEVFWFGKRISRLTGSCYK